MPARKKFKWPAWWPSLPEEEDSYASFEVVPAITFELETVDRMFQTMVGSDEFDRSFAELSGDPVPIRVRMGVYYSPDYDWFEVTP